MLLTNSNIFDKFKKKKTKNFTQIEKQQPEAHILATQFFPTTVKSAPQSQEILYYGLGGGIESSVKSFQHADRMYLHDKCNARP